MDVIVLSVVEWEGGVLAVLLCWRMMFSGVVVIGKETGEDSDLLCSLLIDVNQR